MQRASFRDGPLDNLNEALPLLKMAYTETFIAIIGMANDCKKSAVFFNGVR